MTCQAIEPRDPYDPNTGEVRYIEVKGRWEPTLVVELTETEFEYAKKFGKDYWLYIVYDIVVICSCRRHPKLIASLPTLTSINMNT